MLLHLPTVEAVPNSWGTAPIEDLMTEISRRAPNKPDSIMEYYDFEVQRPMGVVETQPMCDYTKLLRQVRTGLPFGVKRDTKYPDVFGLPYLGDIVELKIPGLMPSLLTELHRQGEVADTLGFLANLYLVRLPSAGARPNVLLSFLARYYGKEGISKLTKLYGEFMRGLRRTLQRAGLHVHCATDTLHRVRGTCLYVPGSEAEVAGAVTAYLEGYAHIITGYKAVIMCDSPTEASNDVLLYDEFGNPSEFNAYQHEVFGEEVAVFYRKRKLQALLS